MLRRPLCRLYLTTANSSCSLLPHSLRRRYQTSRHLDHAIAVPESAQIEQLPDRLNQAQDGASRRRNNPPGLASFVPLDQFSTSIFSVPVLLLLRLFYQAAPFQPNDGAPPRSATFPSQVKQSEGPVRNARWTPHNAPNFLDSFAKYEAVVFRNTIQRDIEQYSKLKLISMTWIKALASPLSHEYLQLIVQDINTGRRWRIVADRSDQGDIVVVGWDWTSSSYVSHHHILPLPLLTLNYEAASVQPSLVDVAKSLAETSERRPYSLFREMCWWYSETAFNNLLAEYPQGTVQEWPCANLRYSFIVRTNWLQRRRLVRHAEQFKQQNMTAMGY